MEIRKWITLYSRELKVSNKGNVMIKSLKWERKELKQYDKQWYRRVNICKWSRIYQWMVHRLVAKAFLWLDISKWREECALHKNDIRHDNRVENIFVWNYKDNAVDRAKKWRWVSLKWSDNPLSKLNETDVLKIKGILREWKLFHSEIWKIFWVWRDAIQKIASWKNLKHI